MPVVERGNGRALHLRLQVNLTTVGDHEIWLERDDAFGVGINQRAHPR